MVSGPSGKPENFTKREPALPIKDDKGTSPVIKQIEKETEAKQIERGDKPLTEEQTQAVRENLFRLLSPSDSKRPPLRRSPSKNYPLDLAPLDKSQPKIVSQEQFETGKSPEI
jgi:hypothetical protein